MLWIYRTFYYVLSGDSGVSAIPLKYFLLVKKKIVAAIITAQ